MKILNNNKTHLIGLGGAGTNVLEYIVKKKLNAKFTCVNNFERKDLSSFIHFIKFAVPESYKSKDGQRFIEFPSIYQVVFFENEIKKLVNESNDFVLFAGLGGFSGSYLIEELANKLKGAKKKYRLICVLPFLFEGDRQFESQKALSILKQNHKVETFSLSDLQTENKDILFSEFMDIANEKIANLYDGQIRKN